MQAQTLATVLYTVGVAVFAITWVRNIRRDAETRRRLEIAEFKAKCFEDCQHLDKAYERVHEMADSVLRGCPVVKFKHPPPIPSSADHWYFRVRIEGKDHLFTEEAVRDARNRASLLIHPSSASLPEQKT